MRIIVWSLSFVVAVELLAGCEDKTPPPYHSSSPWGGPGVVPADSGPDAARDAATDTPRGDGTSPCAVDPGTIQILGGELSGNLVSGSSPTVTVPSGGLLLGSLQLRIARKDDCATCGFALAAAASWREPEDYLACQAAGPGTTERTLDININGPFDTGTHSLIVAGLVAHTCDELMSASTGQTIWGDGNDVAAWSPSALAEAASQGSACVPWTAGGKIVQQRVPAAVVRVKVE